MVDRRQAGPRGRLLWRGLSVLALALTSVASRADDVTAWVPAKAQSFDIGERVEINGVPMRLQGFVSSEPVPAVVKALRESWPRPFTEDRIGPRWVFGRLLAGHYLTVQIEATADGGTRGLSTVTPVREALRADPSREAHEALRHLPVGSTLVQQQRSVDGDRLASLVVARNRLDAATNAEHLVERMQADGFMLDRRARQPADAGQAVGTPRGEVLMFSAGRRQAMAVISRDPAGDSTVVLTTSAPRELPR